MFEVMLVTKVCGITSDMAHLQGSAHCFGRHKWRICKIQRTVLGAINDAPTMFSAVFVGCAFMRTGLNIHSLA
ncbi:hypothetical protein HA51_18180 [Pantoea rwandensis]|uniref:Uncharacterized protein n=1 Tax=Pantoea rwandensis TaxID=1076550 RepID=A0A1X1CTS2_9GAMM|nr:hypothetical protein HA51_18180 [Pantoea rwandensis]